jgi:hypothetical protein
LAKRTLLGILTTRHLLKFRIGSLTKQFTALLILQLKQAGKLKLDDKITHSSCLGISKHRQQINHSPFIEHDIRVCPTYTDEADRYYGKKRLLPKAFALKIFQRQFAF